MSHATRHPRRRSAARLILAAALAGAAPVALTATAPPAAAVDPLSVFHTPPVTTARVLDTRSMGVPLAADGTMDLTLAGVAGIPLEATAVVLNVTVPAAVAPGYVTVWPAGAPKPLASNLNTSFVGQDVANLVTTRLGAGGAVSLFMQGGGHLVADVVGWYTPAAGAVAAGRYVAAPTPARALDTREGVGAPAGRLRAGASRSFTVTGLGGGTGVPADAEGVVVVARVVDATAPGWVRVWTSGGVDPMTSTLNASVVGQEVANLAIVRPGTGGQLSVATQSGGHVVVDVLGWFTGASAPASTSGLFTPADPTRLLDTRDGTGGVPAGRRGPGSTVVIPAGGAAGAAAAALNVTVTDAALSGTAELLPPGSGDPLGTFDAGPPAPVLARAALAPVTGGSITVRTTSGGNLLADLAGWYAA